MLFRSPADLSEVAGQIRQMLAEGDMAAEDLLRAHAAGLRQHWGARFDAVQAAVADFDLARAAELLKPA